MNSEELELSLRAEFENYLKGVFAGMQQDVADFQKNFEAEFEKHKTQMDEAFRNLSTRFDPDVEFDRGFTESVVEHLRLARDDGAQLSAQAFADAQKLEDATPVEPAHYDRLRDAINDISGQLTQSAILKSLVDHVSNFTPRGAFFIVKSENFVCWRKFDRSGHADDDSVRAIHFPIDSDTVLADAVRDLTSISSTSHSDDSVYLDALGFGRPDQMYAVPLLARGRGVAVLYVDRGDGSDSFNLEAIESLVRVAGLTVELRAAAAITQPAVAETSSAAAEPAVSEESAQQDQPAPDAWTPAEAMTEAEEAVDESPAAETDGVEEYTGAVAVEEVAGLDSYEEAPQASVDAGYFEPVAHEEKSAEPFQESAVEEAPTHEPVNDFAFASSDSYDASAQSEPEPEPVEEYAYAGETANGTNGRSYEAMPEPVVEVSAAQPTKSRLSDRNVDLPIEVSDDERRVHNDARRFARLLVSEIKLYNEQKVNEGREAADLYDRLREAIDRSREMYDKRVQPQVAAKFDYFHYELVSNLAEGNDQKLGGSYPGASV